MIWLERRWAVDVLSGFAGAEESNDVLAPRQDEVDYAGAYRQMLRRGSFLAGLGMRLALMFCALSPLWLLGRPRRFRSLSGPERAALLDRLLCHRVYLVAELTLLMKLCACMALFRSETVRDRSSYDSVEEEAAEVLESGDRPKLALPILPEEIDRGSDQEVA